MSAGPWFSFDPKLSWDGLLTFLGGLLAFFAILYQVRHADTGLRTQFQAEKDARSDELAERKRAIATVILFEIDRFYRFYVAEVLKVWIAGRPTENSIPTIESPGRSPFPVYATNCGHIGELDQQLAQTVVDFYASAQRHAFRICEYADKRNSSNPGHALALLGDIKSGAENLVSLAYIACAYLCVYTGINFNAEFETAKHEYMNDATLAAAQDAVAAYRTKLKR